MKHIFSVERSDGTFPEVGMTDRWVRIGITTRSALIQARMAARAHRARVRLESWIDSDFYKPGSKPSTRIVGPFV